MMLPTRYGGINLNFHFTDLSLDLRHQIHSFMAEEKNFVLYDNEGNWKAFLIDQMKSLCSMGVIIDYNDTEQLKADLSISILSYDLIKEIHFTGKVENCSVKFITP